MQIDKSLIEKFLENRCSAEEARLVHRYLTGHPEVLQEYYRHDWEDAVTGEAPDSEHATAMYQAISDNIYAKKATVLRYMPWAAAAAVVIVALSIWWRQPAQQTGIAPATITTITKHVQQEPLVVDRHQQQNTTRKTVKVSLPDGSVVSLAPSAVIKYEKAFGADKREVILEGEALFEVVKDKTRPFTVYSGSLSTTALGTSFRVSEGPSAVRVQLLTGKVVVKAVKPSLAGWKKDVYLLPGQQMRYDAAAGMVKVSAAGVNEQPRNAPAIAHHPDGQMVFDNTPLQQVLDKLTQHYKVSIGYTAKELNGLSFSGTVFHNDSLPVILQAIGRMNDLSVTVVPDGFCIKKAPKE